MCGIVGTFGNKINEGVQSLIHRGPDDQSAVTIGNLKLGHTRLSIIDPDTRSNQPFVYGDITLVFNGEIWNYSEIRDELVRQGFAFRTSGDTEVLAASLNYWGVDALRKINGMFAIAWTKDGETLYLARDKYGEIPLHIALQKPFCFASELKALLAMGCNRKAFSDIEPGTYAIVTARGIQRVAYYDIDTSPRNISRKEASKEIYRLLENGTTERTISDVPVCTLLSGGIDSAIVAYFASKAIPNLVAYTAVYDNNSRDLRSARIVANQIGIELREIVVPKPSYNDLTRVIECIEMPYKAQIEIGWACYKLAEAIQRDGFKVTFSGEGSDELWASYGFAYHGLQKQGWHEYRKDLFLSQARKNFARCNKIFMSHSIECRLPFLHPPLVDYAISLPRTAVQDGAAHPKAVLQEAFSHIFPESIIKRPKVAFQDGMGIKEAIERSITNPKRFYNAEYTRLYG